MSILIMSQVWANSKSTGSSRLILLAIADFANDQGSAFPSIETLAKKSRVSERTVQYCLRELVALGELEIMENQGRKGCNLYRVQNLQGCNLEHEGVQSTTQGGAIYDIKGCNGLHPNRHRTVIEPSMNRQYPLTPLQGEKSDQQKSVTAPKEPKPKSELQLRAEALMGRRVSTPLNRAEQRAYIGSRAAIEATTEEDWISLERFYAAPQSKTYARKDLAALLNNWNGEIDRAKKWRPYGEVGSPDGPLMR